ncbi:hypothetical protein [[Phormidium] sp. ETS-05]|uniref:hypothetical protein n=1 Tax=[Phormidium] sp. ETS-05 TaxID=222819 RepID=UPI0018EF23FA|nr:hypothetical protein [[Phormidium] sp. ETS-05]
MGGWRPGEKLLWGEKNPPARFRRGRSVIRLNQSLYPASPPSISAGGGEEERYGGKAAKITCYQ